MNIKTLVPIAVFAMFFIGCSSKEVEEYNKPADYWYSQIIKNVSHKDLEKADSYYSSLQSEHIASPLLKEATMILAVAHIREDEYLLAEHFLDEYIKRYASENEKEVAEFLKVKSKYMALPNSGRDQAFLDDSIEAAQKFQAAYVNSMYKDMVDTMLTRMYLAKYILKENISSLYERVDKPKSAAYYKPLASEDWIASKDIVRAKVPWYRAWFEGDGTSSWYSFLIPHTKSVISRNSINEDENETK